MDFVWAKQVQLVLISQLAMALRGTPLDPAYITGARYMVWEEVRIELILNINAICSELLSREV